MTRHSYDVIVLGVGGMGSSAVYHLAKRGVDVLGIEQYDIPHGRGSSHGDTRIFRLVQPEHPSYVPLAERARTLWRELETESGKNILTETGSVHAGPADAGHVSDAIESCVANDIPHEILSGAALQKRFPGYELPDDYRGVYQPNGGYLACERAISTHVTLAHEHGGTVRARERVLDWTPREHGVEVRTNRETYEADHLVMTAGAWAGNQTSLLDSALSPQRRVMLWLQPREPSKFTPETFPVFNVDVPEGEFYGFPVADRPGFKFGYTPAQADAIDPNDWNDEPTLEDEKRLRRLTENHFPAASGPTLRLATCLVTRSLDGHFYLDTHPEYPHISIAAGFTGHGFKFSSVVGEILADFATRGETEMPIDVHRFGTRLSEV